MRNYSKMGLSAVVCDNGEPSEVRGDGGLELTTVDTNETKDRSNDPITLV